MLRSGFGDGCTRLSRLVDEEAEADEEFWGQDAFKEVRFHRPWNQAFRIFIFICSVCSKLYLVSLALSPADEGKG